MKRLLRDYWAWFFVPFLLTVAIVALLVFGSTPSDSVTPFTYRVF